MTHDLFTQCIDVLVFLVDGPHDPLTHLRILIEVLRIDKSPDAFAGIAVEESDSKFAGINNEDLFIAVGTRSQNLYCISKTLFGLDDGSDLDTAGQSLQGHIDHDAANDDTRRKETVQFLYSLEILIMMILTESFIPRMFVGMGMTMMIVCFFLGHHVLISMELCMDSIVIVHVGMTMIFVIMEMVMDVVMRMIMLVNMSVKMIVFMIVGMQMGMLVGVFMNMSASVVIMLVAVNMFMFVFMSLIVIMYVGVTVAVGMTVSFQSQVLGMHVFMLVDMVFDVFFKFVDMFSKISHGFLLMISVCCRIFGQ